MLITVTIAICYSMNQTDYRISLSFPSIRYFMMVIELQFQRQKQNKAQIIDERN